MDVSGKNQKVWCNEHQKRDGSKWYEYNVSISKKKQDGSYVNAYIKVKFSKDVDIEDPIPNGVKMDYEGFMTVDEYTDRDGNIVRKPMLFVTKAVFPELESSFDSFAEVEEAIPF